jgi:hypothetical protein
MVVVRAGTIGTNTVEEGFRSVAGCHPVVRLVVTPVVIENIDD